MWYEIRIDNCPKDTIDLISDSLEEQGAVSITLTDKNDDAILEPLPGTVPLWPEVILTALYNDEIIAQLALKSLKESEPHLSITFSSFEDEDWVKTCIKDFKPQCFGNRLWVSPDIESIPDVSSPYLILPPGLAFGTGTHPTTHLCLNWLSNHELANKTIIDYGSGSGILALAALKLGAKLTYAVDIDPQALVATANNAETNRLRNKINISLPEELSEPVDLIIANILLTPLMALKPRFQSLLKPGGQLIMTGLLEQQVETIIERYQPDFTLTNTYFMDGWGLVEFQY